MPCLVAVALCRCVRRSDALTTLVGPLHLPSLALRASLRTLWTSSVDSADRPLVHGSDLDHLSSLRVSLLFLPTLSPVPPDSMLTFIRVHSRRPDQGGLPTVIPLQAAPSPLRALQQPSKRRQRPHHRGRGASVISRASVSVLTVKQQDCTEEVRSFGSFMSVRDSDDAQLFHLLHCVDSCAACVLFAQSYIDRC